MLCRHPWADQTLPRPPLGPANWGAVLGELHSRSGGGVGDGGTEAIRQAARGFGIQWDGFLLVGG